MITPAQYEEMKARLSGPGDKGLHAPSSKEAYPGLESDLHDQIVAELIRRRWFFVHSRMDCRTTTQKGVPDFICAAPGNPPDTFWIEAKRKGAKLSKEQNITRHILLALGHKYKIVYSIKDFLDLIDKRIT
jgi:hypothetical protein